MNGNITLKSINENLPRLDTLRRDYAPMGTVGIEYWRIGYLRAAIADIDEEHRRVTDITIYTPGDAMKTDHYRGGGFDITEQIEEALRDFSIDRRTLILSIKYAIETELQGWDKEEV